MQEKEHHKVPVGRVLLFALALVCVGACGSNGEICDEYEDGSVGNCRSEEAFDRELPMMILFYLTSSPTVPRPTPTMLTLNTNTTLSITDTQFVRYDVPAAGLYYFYVDGGCDADICLYTSFDSAYAASGTIQSSCVVGASSAIARGIGAAADQISLTVNDGSASYPREVYGRIRHDSSLSCSVQVGVRSSPYGGAATNSNYSFTNN